MQNGRRSKRSARNGTVKKQKRGADARLEELMFAEDPEPTYEAPQHGLSSSKLLTAAIKLSLQQLMAAVDDNDTDSDFDAEAIAEFKKNNPRDKLKKIASAGLQDETKEDLMKNYANTVPALKVPVLNPEIAEVLPEALINYDNEVVERQNQVAAAVAAILQALKGLATQKKKRSEVMNQINDAAMLIADTQHKDLQQQRMMRRLLADLAAE